MIIDYCDKTINVKIVYFGPALSGKTTSIRSLFSYFGKEQQLESIESTMNRTLFFDYGTIIFQDKEWDLKIHIYTTTGQDFYFVTRPITLRAVDGIIFVADSNLEVYDRNLISWNELISYFEELLIDMPIIIAFNKQDLSEKWDPIKFLNEIGFYDYKGIDTRYTIAIRGEGIQECFEDLKRRILEKILDKYPDSDKISLKN